MPGTIVFKPIEANLTHNTDFIKKMNPYCAFIVGSKRINSQISKHGGKHPHWNDAVTVPYANESKIMVELMDKDRITKDDHIGSFMIDLPEIEAQGQSSRWYPLYYKNKPAGEILLEATVEGTGMLGSQGFVGTTGYQQETIVSQPFVEREEVLLAQQPVIEKEVGAHLTGSEMLKTFVEQRQTVEPHTFLKEVDYVETRAVQQTIEVLEPRKVLKDVQYTEAVPVKKQIETIEPQVVTKEVEVMEPRLVTKTIQVVENVPVKKQIEVIESIPVMREVETFEPQTFTKQIEVTEQVPVMRTVTVTEPVHLKKNVEFVEPVITTQTITKEIRPEVIVNEQVTKSVGPATYLGEVRQVTTQFSQITLTEQEKTRYLGMTEQERLSLNEEERLKWQEARRLSGGNYSYGTTGYTSTYGTSTYSGSQFNFSEQDRLRYLNLSEKERLALKGDELLRWQECQRLYGSGLGSQTYSTNYSQQGLGGQGMQYLGDVDKQQYQHSGTHHKKF
jgi:hypothetical protein